MNGATWDGSFAALPSTPTAWSMVASADFNGDGNADILWRNDNGALAVWTMSGFSVTSSGIAGYVDGTWGII